MKTITTFIARLSRLLGMTNRPADLSGRVHSVVTGVREGADRPPWAHLVSAAAIVVTAAAAVALMAPALAWRRLTGRARPHSRAAAPKGIALPFLAGVGLETLLKRRDTPIQVWKLDTHQGRWVVRIAISPAHASDVRPGDVVDCWGSENRDGTFRAFRATNRTTDTVIRPKHASYTAVAVSILAALILVEVLARAL